MGKLIVSVVCVWIIVKFIQTLFYKGTGIIPSHNPPFIILT
jgi:hypothetical protein